MNFNIQTFAPGVEYFNNLITKEDANFIINTCEKANNNYKHPWKFQTSKVDNKITDKSIRTSQDMHIHKRFIKNEETIRVYDILYDAIYKAGQQYCLKYGINFDGHEAFSFIKYNIGNEYKPHCDDGLVKPFSERQTAVIVYLNPTEYTGGETYLNHFDISIKPDNTGVLLFPCNYAYLHQSLKITNGIKYIVVSFLKKPQE